MALVLLQRRRGVAGVGLWEARGAGHAPCARANAGRGWIDLVESRLRGARGRGEGAREIRRCRGATPRRRRGLAIMLDWPMLLEAAWPSEQERPCSSEGPQQLHNNCGSPPRGAALRADAGPPSVPVGDSRAGPVTPRRALNMARTLLLG